MKVCYVNITPGLGGKYWEYKGIFPFIFFSRLLCFSFNKVVFKKFPWTLPFAACFWKKKLTNLGKYSNNQRITHVGFCIINDYKRKVNYTWPNMSCELDSFFFSFFFFLLISLVSILLLWVILLFVTLDCWSLHCRKTDWIQFAPVIPFSKRD